MILTGVSYVLANYQKPWNECKVLEETKSQSNAEFHLGEK